MFANKYKELVLVESVVEILTDVCIWLLPWSLLHLLHLLVEVIARMQVAYHLLSVGILTGL